MLYSGIPRKRRKGVAGGNKIACALCGVPGLSLDMVWQSADAPGWPRVRALVHPECKDLPQGTRNPPVRPQRPPYITQNLGVSQTLPTDAITISAAVFATTGTTSATTAQLQADPTVTLTGTGFTTRTYGRVHHNSSLPLVRVTTYTNATTISFELEAVDINAGSLWVGAARIDHGTQITSAIQLTVT